LRGQEPNIINGTVHGPGYSGGAAITQSFGFTDKRFDTDYHLFAVEWTESSIDFFVDDVLYQRITPGDLTGEWVYDAPFFIILNVAVGGNYVGFPVPQTPFPQTMSVDYVRVYR
ncbi:MAG: glycoside hydrolase family 16 protein, partial [Saprospiraceae bacterium]|nr:glycoside hydrolase family 16 protein [Saprospiraceae bacterium]